MDSSTKLRGINYNQEPPKISKAVQNMYFEASTSFELRDIIEERVTAYENSQKMDLKQSDRDLIKLIFEATVTYITNYTRMADRSYDSIIKLITSAYTSSMFKISPFMKIIERAVSSDDFSRYTPISDLVLIKVYERRNDINNKLLDGLMDFVRWDVAELENDRKEELYGMITLWQSKSMEEHPDRVKMKRPKKSFSVYSKRTKAHVPADMKAKAEAFLEKYTPEKIKEFLDSYIIGQDNAKKTMATAVYNHYLRIANPDAKLVKTNVLLIGPSGSGKTEIIRVLKKIIDVPVVLDDFSGIVATPWKGRNKEEILARLIDASDKRIREAEFGIVFLDEADKIIEAMDGGIHSGLNIRDELQGQMLGMIEGTELEIPYQDQKVILNTDNILFVLSGAFEGLEDIVREDIRRDNESSFGVNISGRDVLVTNNNIKIKHLTEYGMKTELAGRIGNISVLNKLTKDEMRQILVDTNDNILQKYKNELMLDDGIVLEFTNDAIDAIVEKSQELDIGARGLNVVLHECLADIMFEAPSIEGVKRVVVKAETVNNNERPDYYLEEE